MWCARYGHLECGIILAQWSPDSLRKRDSDGHNSVQIAVSRGFTKFASELEKIQVGTRGVGNRGSTGFGQVPGESSDFTLSTSCLIFKTFFHFIVILNCILSASYLNKAYFFLRLINFEFIDICIGNLSRFHSSNSNSASQDFGLKGIGRMHY